MKSIFRVIKCLCIFFVHKNPFLKLKFELAPGLYVVDCCPDDLLCFSLRAEEVQPAEDLTVNLSDLASLSTNTLLHDSSAANPFKLFIWKKYAFIIVFLITPNR